MATPLRRWHVLLSAFTLSGCIYRTEEFPKLDPGDVTGVLVGTPPGDVEVHNLAGGRVGLRFSNILRSAAHDGRFTLRGLSEGDHTLLLSYDPDGDRQPNLVGVVKVPVKVRAGNRASVDLGDVVLLPPSTITGRLVPPSADPTCVDVSAMEVFIGDTELHVRPDATAHFRITGLGAFTWTVAAVGGGATATREVTVGADETVDVGDLQVECSTAKGSITVVVMTGDGSNALDTVSRPLSAFEASACNPNNTCVTIMPNGNQYIFNNLALDAYALDVNMGNSFLPVHHAFAVLAHSQDPVLLELTASELPATGDLDLDGDGFPEGAPEHCRDTCRMALLTDRLATCDGRDCDDDGDGQSDLDEMGGQGFPGCHCNATGGGEATTCERDPSRYDFDFDGYCDAYQPHASSSSSSGGTSSSMAPPSSSLVAASSSASSTMLSSSTSAATSGVTLPSSSATSRATSSVSSAASSSSVGASSSGGAGDTVVATLEQGAFVMSMAVNTGFLTWIDRGAVWMCNLQSIPCTPQRISSANVNPYRVGTLTNTIVWSESPTAINTAGTLHHCTVSASGGVCSGGTPITSATGGFPPLGFLGVFASSPATGKIYLAIDDNNAGVGGFIQVSDDAGLFYANYPNPITGASFLDVTVSPFAAPPPPAMVWARTDMTVTGLEGCTTLPCMSPFIAYRNQVERAALSVSTIYWLEMGTIYTCPVGALAGSTCNKTPLTPAVDQAHSALALDTNSMLYWVRDVNGAPTIQRRAVP